MPNRSQITFDPRKVTFGTLLRIYFSVAHDPTELNRQGPDTGTQYRSEIFAASPAAGRNRQGLYRPAGMRPISSPRPSSPRSEPLKGFYPAEDYHQDYLFHNPRRGLHRLINDLPKIAALKRVWPAITGKSRCLLARE